MTKREKLLTVMILVLVGFIGLTYFTRTETDVLEFDCGGTGLRITGNRISYGSAEFEVCEKRGTIIYGGSTCPINGNQSTLMFDEVSKQFALAGTFKQCVRVN
jgi:hypothetical protein